MGLRHIPGSRHDELHDVARLLTDLVSPRADIAVLLVVAALVSRRRHSSLPLGWATATVALMATTVLAVKIALGRPGPRGIQRHDLVGAYPSGHTTSVVVCGAAIVLLLGLQHRRAVWVVYAVIVNAVGAGLVYAHYHWLSDVVGSLLLGTLILLAVGRRLITARQRSGARAEAIAVRGSPSG